LGSVESYKVLTDLDILQSFLTLDTWMNCESPTILTAVNFK